MREVVLDTETTGLNPDDGDRIVEIGCVELLNHLPTGEEFHTYINPGMTMPESAFKIHGLSDEFLRDKPGITDVLDAFLDFLGSSTLVIHNAEFDLKFLRREISVVGGSRELKNQVVDTLSEARKKFPGAQASLDALCRRFKIDNSDRELHGALKDARILSKVYFELLGGSQTDLKLINDVTHVTPSKKNNRVERVYDITTEEKREHEKFLEKIKNPIWLN